MSLKIDSVSLLNSFVSTKIILKIVIFQNSKTMHLQPKLMYKI